MPLPAWAESWSGLAEAHQTESIFLITCVDISSLPLQLLRREHPEWAGLPVAVVEDDKPQALVLFISRAASEAGIRAGMRYGAALGLCPALKAATILPGRIDEVRAEIVGALHRTSPRVEADAERAGTFWVDPSGMTAIFGTTERFAHAVHDEISGRALAGNVVVGFSRLSSWAIARVHRGVTLLRSPAEERSLASKVALARLALPLDVKEALHTLGVRTVGELLELPRGDLSVRLGRDAARIHALFSDTLRPPLEPAKHASPVEVSAEIDPPDVDEARILFCLKGAVHALISALATRRMGLAALEARFELEPAPGRAIVTNPGASTERPPPETVGSLLRPSRASRDEASLVELVRIRLGSLSLPRPVCRLVLSAEPAPIDETQLVMLDGARTRDPDAIARGLARLRAAFGDDAVTVPKLEDGWLPETSYRWEPVRSVRAPRARTAAAEAPPLVRRLFAHPLPMQERDGRPVSSPRIASLSGPYRLEAGWWDEARVVRDYFYGEREDGALLWLFRDASSRRWFLQGIVD